MSKSNTNRSGKGWHDDKGGEEKKKKKKSKVRRRGNYHIVPAFVAWRHCQHISSRLRLNNKLRMLTTLCSCSASKSIHKIHRYIYIFISSCGALKIGQRPVEFNDWKMRHLSWVPASFPHPSSLSAPFPLHAVPRRTCLATIWIFMVRLSVCERVCACASRSASCDCYLWLQSVPVRWVVH